MPEQTYTLEDFPEPVRALIRDLAVDHAEYNPDDAWAYFSGTGPLLIEELRRGLRQLITTDLTTVVDGYGDTWTLRDNELWGMLDSPKGTRTLEGIAAAYDGVYEPAKRLDTPS